MELSQLEAALHALASIPQLSEVMAHGCEVRAVRADTFLLSPVNRRFLSGNESDVFGAIHFTMDHFEHVQPLPSTDSIISDGSVVEKVRPPKGQLTQGIQQAVKLIAQTLKPFNARPHWAKLAATSSEVEEAAVVAASKDEDKCYEEILKTWYSDESSARFWRKMIEYDPEGKFRSKHFDQVVKSIVMNAV